MDSRWQRRCGSTGAKLPARDKPSRRKYSVERPVPLLASGHERMFVTPSLVNDVPGHIRSSNKDGNMPGKSFLLIVRIYHATNCCMNTHWLGAVS